MVPEPHDVYAVLLDELLDGFLRGVEVIGRVYVHNRLGGQRRTEECENEKEGAKRGSGSTS